MRRFYAQAEAVAVDGGYGIVLDGKPVRTPARALLVVPRGALAQAIAAEWQSQGESIDPRTMPFTRLASTALDWVEPHRELILDELAGYAGTDLVCYRAEAPPELVARQHAVWQPLVDWAWLRFDAPLQVTTGVVPLKQPPPVHGAFRTALAGLDVWSLMVLHALTTGAGSLVIGFAGLERRLTADEVWHAAALDEMFQAEEWGEDALAAKARAELCRDMDDALRFAELAGVGQGDPRDPD